jgi:hypothetical protein
MSFITGEKASKMFVEFHDSISTESDRGAVLVSAALLDEGLKELIKAKLVKNSLKSDVLFDGVGAPLGSFASRIEISFRLGLISNSVKSVLKIFRRLRNDCAHSPAQISLENTSAKTQFDTILREHSDIRDALEEIVIKKIQRYFRRKIFSLILKYFTKIIGPFVPHLILSLR